MHGTVAAAFADGFVDDGTLGRIRVFIAFPAAAFFRGAGLVVDHGRHAGHVAQFALHVHQFRTVAHGDAFGPGVIVRVFFRFVRDDDDGTDAFGGDLARNDGRRQGAIEFLAARHGHRIVEQNFIRDVHLGRDGSADGQDARVEIRAVAEVGKHVLFICERRLSHPRDAFGAHVGKRRRFAVHP
ncbi:hypothetical protein D3C72_1215650 [compost metagenome]